MKVSPDALAADLRKNLAPIYVVAGDEPLLADECIAMIRAAAEKSGCSERDLQVAERSFDWQAFSAGLRNLSLFASRRLVQLRLPTGKPGDAGSKFLVEICERPPPDMVLVIVLPALDGAAKRSKWATALAQHARWIEVRPPARGELGAWLTRRLQQAGLTAEPEALEALAARVEGNLLAAKQEIDKLALLAPQGRITADMVRDAVADGARFDVFELADAALSGDAAGAIRILDGLERDGTAATLVLWSLVREVNALADVVMRMDQGRSVDQALADAGIWRSRQEVYRRAARDRKPGDAARLVRYAARAEQIVKGVRSGDPWRALVEVTLALSRTRLAVAETA